MIEEETKILTWQYLINNKIRFRTDENLPTISNEIFTYEGQTFGYWKSVTKISKIDFHKMCSSFSDFNMSSSPSL